jgi:hypothetical protein
MTNANRRKFIPPSHYDRSIMKSYEKKKKSAGSSDVLQLGAQKMQSIEPLVVGEQQGLIAFVSIYRFLVSFVSCRMEIQTCRKNDYFHLGFVNPVVVNFVL